MPDRTSPHPNPPDPMSLDGFAPLAPNARLLWMLRGAIGVGVLTLVLAIVELSMAHKIRSWPMPWPRVVPGVALAGGVALLVATLVGAAWQYARFGYRVSDDDLIVQSGAIFRTRRCVPRSRVQHVDVASGPIDRAFGLVEVRLYVAGGVGAVAEISGLAPEAAHLLKEALVDPRADGV